MIDTTIGSNVGIRILSQNIYQKYEWTNSVLVSHDTSSCKFKFNIFFLQEPPWLEIKHTASMKDKQGTPEMGMLFFLFFFVFFFLNSTIYIPELVRQTGH